MVNQWSAPSKKNVVKKGRFGNTGFIVSHYAAEVTYESAGFIEKNRDTLPEEHLDMLDTTTNDLLRQILDNQLPPSHSTEQPPRPFSPARSDHSDFSTTVRSFDTSTTNATRLGISSTFNNSTSSRPPTPHRPDRPPTPASTHSHAPDTTPLRSETAITRKQTLGTLFKSSLTSLMDTISMTNPHYVRCIKPNRTKTAWEFDSKHVLSQLKACGILETVKISCAGYPSRWSYEDFASRYVMG